MKISPKPGCYTLAAAVAILAVHSICVAESRRLTAREASDYIGQSATVCGHVASTKFTHKSKGQSTYLHITEPYPNQTFTVLVWANNNQALGSPGTRYEGKNICATGLIKNSKGTPEIIAENASQITLAR